MTPRAFANRAATRAMMPVIRLSTVLLLGVTGAYWAALRKGWGPQSPGLLAALAAAVLLLLLANAALLFPRLRRPRERRGRAAAALLATAGLALALAGGLANWLFSLQGYVILNERESVELERTSRLHAFEEGPLADRSEMRGTLVLERLELSPAGAAFFEPVSRLRLLVAGAAPVALAVAPNRSAALRTLRFHQGAFGFAPRIVITKGDATVFDRVVPFTSERLGETGVRFEGAFTEGEERLSVKGMVSLDALDDRMKGHPRLALRVEQEGQLLGAGELSPGHFAELERGYRIGFAGLERWSEIDISRRTYTLPILAGLALLATGAVLWPLALWRRW